MDNSFVELRLLGTVITRDDIPKYATVGSAGVDLRASVSQPVTIDPNTTVSIPTGVAIHTNNPSIMSLLAPRSGLAIKHRILLANGVGIIDSDYQNEIIAVLWNCGDSPYVIEPKDRIAQLIFVQITQLQFKVVDQFKEESVRGLGGFGHTGKK
ncbi:MAG: dUTP diphosphatase [Methylacidiphilales bacterium]|nr:dUTP diphosphatase [Candidatus Methylacidiphilales bacterium]